MCDEQQADHDAALDPQFQELQITAGRHGDELKTSRMEISELNLTIQEVYASWRQDLPVEHKLHPAQQGRKQSQVCSVPFLGPLGLGEDRGNGFLAALG